MDCLKKVSRASTDRIPLVIPYRPSLPNISQIILKHWKILCKKHPKAKKTLPQPPMVCYTRDKNLRDILVKAVLPPPTRSVNFRSKRHSFFRCGKRGDCVICAHSVNSTSVNVYTPGTPLLEFPINSRITCTDENLIYLMFCTKSNGECIKHHPQYVGETGKSAKWRCARHIGTVTNSSQTDTQLPVQVFISGCLATPTQTYSSPPLRRSGATTPLSRRPGSPT